MPIRFVPAALADIGDALTRHLSSLPDPVDSFVEDQVAAAHHYRILVDDAPAGFASIHSGSLIVQFSLDNPWKRHGQEVFRRLRQQESVQAALVATCDPFFLAHAIDDYRQLLKQAHFFSADPNEPLLPPAGYALRPAEPSDIDPIRAESGEFFREIAPCIEKRELFVTLRGDETVAFGVMDRSRLCGPTASIGMFVIERLRRQGIGAATLRLLRAQCRREGLREIAGCWYYNHASKKTLESAGLFAKHRLLRIEY